nr:topoisomerase 1-associated factor 1 [Quercus suber]
MYECQCTAFRRACEKRPECADSVPFAQGSMSAGCFTSVPRTGPKPARVDAMEVWEKSETVDPEVRAYVYSLVNAVGGSSTYDDTYAVGDDALAALQDILRWIRLYDDKLLRYANLVKGDLVQILAQWQDDVTKIAYKGKIALACLNLATSLTWPFELEEERTTVNNLRHLPYLQLAQVGYKRALLHHEFASVLQTIVRLSLPCIVQTRRERSSRDEGTIKLVLYLCRNLAMIAQPQHLPSQGDENEISRSATIDAFKSQDVLNLLLTIGSGASDDFQDHVVILLEILFHLLKGVDPKKLFLEKEQLTSQETDELQSLMRQEKAMLNGYKKHAPSRHNRFGTMIWVKRDNMKVSTVTGQSTITDESTTLYQMDASKKWNKPKPRGKLSQEFNEQSDFGQRVDLTETARANLRSFVEDFLDSSFNPLFSSLRRAIEREDDRVEPRSKRQYFYLVNWFLDAECSRRDQARRESQWHADRPTQVANEDNTFAYIAAVLDQETFVLLNRHMQRAFDEKSWQDLQATLLCFTQILLTVQSMAESKDEEDQEIAENIQSRIFYEETTHDRIVQILRGYTTQGFVYLDAITECVHVFVRMLERYSKQNADLTIRSKRRARKKKHQDGESAADAQDDADEAAEEEREAYRVVSERKFDFARFSAKFLSQGCVNTYISMLHFYRDLSPSQLKRCHRYLYRLVFKQDLAILVFRVDILQLLHRMIKGPEGLDPKTEGFNEWQQLVQQIFRKCIKWIERESEGAGWKEMCMVEMLFSKVSSSMFYLQNGYERVVEQRAPRPPAELEIKAAVEEGKRLSVATSLMIDKGKADALKWIRNELQRASEERQTWTDGQSSIERAEEDGESHGQPPPAIFLNPDSDERKAQLFKDKHLRLLLRTLEIERLGAAEDTDALWVVTPEVTAAQLLEAMNAISRIEFDPPTFENGSTAEDLVRNKSTFRHAATNVPGGSDSEDDMGMMFPPNLPESRNDGSLVDKPKKRRRLLPRNKTELTEEQAEERAVERRRRERERNRKIKSELYITAEDDESDEERDAEFFRLEEERRSKIAGVLDRMVLKDMSHEEENGSKKRKKHVKTLEKSASKKTKKRKLSPASDEDENEDHQLISDIDASDASAQTSPARIEISSEDEGSTEEDEDADEDDSREHADAGYTPSTSQPTSETTAHGKDQPAHSQPLSDVSVNVGAATSTRRAARDENDEGEEDMPIAKPVPRRRAGFVFDDSDDE